MMKNMILDLSDTLRFKLNQHFHNCTFYNRNRLMKQIKKCFFYSKMVFDIPWCGVEFYSTSTCGADRRTVAVVITVNVVKVIKQNLQWFGQDLKKNGDNISSFPFSFLSSHPANDYFLLFLVSRGCSADNMQIQRMCEIISRLSNVWGFAHTQMEPFGNFIQHFRFLFMLREGGWG